MKFFNNFHNYLIFGMSLEQIVLHDGSHRWFLDGNLLNLQHVSMNVGEIPEDAVGDMRLEFWYKDGKFHRDDDEPAKTIIVGDADDPDTIKSWWYKNGKILRDGDKPAVVEIKPCLGVPYNFSEALVASEKQNEKLLKQILDLTADIEQLRTDIKRPILSYSGQWQADRWGNIVLDQVGDTVLGYYQSNSSSTSIEGYVNNGIFKGTWGGRRGTFTVELSQDGNSFNGVWTNNGHTMDYPFFATKNK